MGSGFDWGIVLDLGVGLGVLLVGIAALIAAVALRRTLHTLAETLEHVDRQVGEIGTVTVRTLTRVEAAGGALERAAGTIAGVSRLARRAVDPVLINAGAIAGGVSAALRRLVTRGNGAGGHNEGKE